MFVPTQAKSLQKRNTTLQSLHATQNYIANRRKCGEIVADSHRAE